MTSARAAANCQARCALENAVMLHVPWHPLQSGLRRPGDLSAPHRHCANPPRDVAPYGL